jgi:hypothetical protein
MQPSARCLTPWLLWTRALFAVLARYPAPRLGRLGLDFRGWPLGKGKGKAVPLHAMEALGGEEV